MRMLAIAPSMTLAASRGFWDTERHPGSLLAAQAPFMRTVDFVWPSDLPWLDLEQALIVGGGADYGDDTWIALDFRGRPLAPRVVISDIPRSEKGNHGTAELELRWMELAPDIGFFLKLIHGERKPYTRSGPALKWVLD